MRAKPRRAAAELGHAGESCGAGQAEQVERLREVGRSDCSAERAVRSRPEGGKGRGRWAEAGKRREEEGRPIPGLGLKMKNIIFFK